jgi:hypothetical protein
MQKGENEMVKDNSYQIKQWKNNRPTDWVNPHDCFHPDHVDNPFVEQEMCNAFERGASAMLEARDKWWVDKLLNYTAREEIIIILDEWNKLKKEIENG